ncbi:CGNR zinc finger domain-containing protein [Arthrobacter sp. zg-Y20]|uniref:CGNR zinc finger domain-containing protein n=1 Tax=unclassified Arthrobacter TaxID=235627 RepID=UPI001D14680E|nr:MULTISPECIES: CGNR zinc finger domain-containing protein [unclassified Arthrobacter]MCC3275711.1 CGNR zinc finger domain-containing protein [Arthrobacter sp. zg-Y20]MDK1315868.1 CGNR zinc finger domain-containing protein [Arthrobacter sp. zg.Y20]WIB06347.1 CGNR zinc finger domain-containing protein [Arthrobacter sp. zg-Y20]
MHLNPYGEYAVLLAASLANNWPGNRDALVERTLEAGMTMTFPARPDDLARTRTFIDEWLAVVDTPAPGQRAALLNAQMADAAAYPRLTNHDGEGWHLHYRDNDESLPSVLRAIISVGTSLHLVTRGMHRLGRCAAEPCRAVVVDVTRNGRQRYCSVRCANRAAVRRHRSRPQAG